MALITLWTQSDVSCMLSVSGALINVRLMTGDETVRERPAASADHGLSIADLWRVEFSAKAAPRPDRTAPMHVSSLPAKTPLPAPRPKTSRIKPHPEAAKRPAPFAVPRSLHVERL